MVKIVVLNDTRNSHKDRFENDDGFSVYIEDKIKVFITEVGKEYHF